MKASMQAYIKAYMKAYMKVCMKAKMRAKMKAGPARPWPWPAGSWPWPVLKNVLRCAQKNLKKKFRAAREGLLEL